MFVEQSAAFVVQAALVVLDTECLTGRSTDKAIQFAPGEPRRTKKFLGGDIFDRAWKQLALGMACGESLRGMLVNVISCQDLKASLPEPFGKASGAGEKINRSTATAAHRPSGLEGGMVSGSCSERSW